MRTTRPSILGEDPSSLDALWTALTPEPTLSPPLLRAVMISSVDGTTSVDGRTRGLGTPTDSLVFHAMRARADLVVVGSGTALIEDYGPAGVSEVWRDRRHGAPPPVLLLSRTLSDRVVAHCTGAGPAVGVVAAHDADPARIDAARDAGVPVHVLDPGPLGGAVRALATRLGAREVDLEGGPDVLAEMLATGGVDDLILTLAPELVLGGDHSRLVSGGAGATTRVPLRVAEAFSAPDGGLYTRWVVDGTVR